MIGVIKLNITNVKIRRLFDGQPLKAVCSLTINDELAIHDIKIVETGGKILVVMPAKKTARGDFADIVHPINNNARSIIENAVINEYNSQLKK